MVGDGLRCPGGTPQSDGSCGPCSESCLVEGQRLRALPVEGGGRSGRKCVGFLEDFIYLLLERGEGREKERERNINVLPLARPQLGPGLQPRYVP